MSARTRGARAPAAARGRRAPFTAPADGPTEGAPAGARALPHGGIAR